MEKALHVNVNFYDLLGIDRKADKSEVKKAYRELAKKYHPDVNDDPKAENIFNNIKSAYEILSDPYKRSIYDYLLSRREQPLKESQFQRRKQSNPYRQRPKEAYHDQSRELNSFSKGEYVQFHLKQVISLGILVSLFIAGFLLLGVGVRFLFLKDFNGSMVAGYFTIAAGLGLTYGTIKGIKVLVTLWQHGIAEYHGDHEIGS